jgi:hypothetical protein
MDSKDKIIEYLSQPENLSFLLEIEELIPKAKTFLFNQGFKLFTNGIQKKLWDGYKTSTEKDDLIISSAQYKSNSHFNLAVYLGEGDKNNYFGIIGPTDHDNLIINTNPMQEVLNDFSMNNRWRHWGAWIYFKRNRSEILTLSSDNMGILIDEWIEEFWEFADKIRPEIEILNNTISSESGK